MENQKRKREISIRTLIPFHECQHPSPASTSASPLSLPGTATAAAAAAAAFHSSRVNFSQVQAMNPPKSFSNSNLTSEVPHTF